MGVLEAIGLGLEGKIKVYQSKFPAKQTAFWCKLHYSWTSNLLLLSTGLVLCNQWVGRPIRCAPVDDKAFDKAHVNSFCYVRGIYTVKLPFSRSLTMSEWILAGYNGDKEWYNLNLKLGYDLGGPPFSHLEEDQNLQRKQRFYVWAPWVLFFLALLFHAPLKFWCYISDSLVFHLVGNIQAKDLDLEKRKDPIKKIAKYFVRSRGTHFWWSTWYMVSEVSNLLVLAAAVGFIDFCLDGDFIYYGYNVFEYLSNEVDSDKYPNPMYETFPMMSKCTFYGSGAGGNINRREALCILSENALFALIFTWIWWWFLVLGMVSVLCLMKRVATIVSVGRRRTEVEMAMKDNIKVYEIVDRISVSDWMLLNLMRQNLMDHIFDELINRMYDIMFDIETDLGKAVVVVQVCGGGDAQTCKTQARSRQMIPA